MLKEHSLYLSSFLILVWSAPVTESIMEKMLALPIVYHTEQKDTAGPMLPETAELLRKFAAPCNEELAQVLGDDIYLWNDVAPPTSKTPVSDTPGTH